MGDSTAFHAYPLWVANYSVPAPTVPGGWPTWTFWQGTSTGQVQGISGSTDTDSFNGSLSRLQSLAELAPDTSTTSPTPTPGPPPTPASTPVKAPKAPTALTAHLSRSAVRQGKSVTITGTVATDEALPLASRTIRIQQRPAGATSWSILSRQSTGTDGQYSVTISIPSNLELRVIAQGTGTYVRAVSPPLTVTTWVPSPTALTLRVRRNLIQPGSQDRLDGTLTTTDTSTPVTDHAVQLWARSSRTRSWRLRQRASTGPDGRFRFVVTPARSTAYRVRFPGAPHYLRTISPQGTVSIH